jgi:hypothetical protein
MTDTHFRLAFTERLSRLAANAAAKTAAGS